MRDDILDDGIHLPKAKTAENAREILRLKSIYGELHPKVSNGRKALWWLVGLTALGMVVESVQYNFDPVIVGVNGGVVAVFVASAILAKKKPFLGFMIGLILLLIMQILMTIGDPLSSIKGILWRGIIAYFVIVGMSATKEYLSTLKGLKAHDINVEGTELV